MLHRQAVGPLERPQLRVAVHRVISADSALGTWPGPGHRNTDNGSTTHADDVGLALDSALRLLAELVHRGGRHLPPTYADRLRECAATLTTIGLQRCGHALADLARAYGTEDLLINAWIDAQIRLTVSADNR